MKRLFISACVLLGLSLSALTLTANAATLAKKCPPAIKVEVKRPTCPTKHAVWIPGHWSWNERKDTFVWKSGHWDTNPHSKDWIPGHWAKVAGGWNWIEGHWAK